MKILEISLNRVDGKLGLTPLCSYNYMERYESDKEFGAAINGYVSIQFQYPVRNPHLNRKVYFVLWKD